MASALPCRSRPAWVWLACVVMCLLAGAPAGAQTEAYYSITSVTSEYVNNAVRVKIETDGAISANVNKWWARGSIRNYYLDWELVNKQTTNSWAPECYMQVDKIMLHLDRALPTMGNTAEVGKYPVSHVRFIPTDRTQGGVGLDVEVVLQKRMRIRKYKFGQDEMWDAYWFDHHDPAWFEMSVSPDQRSLIITVASDRLPERVEHRALADIPESARELRVSGDAAHLAVHARNVPLSEVVEAVGRATGVSLSATEEAAGRVVTAELPDTNLEECTMCLADAYGLARYRQGEALVFSDAMRPGTSAQAPVGSARIALRNLKARTAADLLPNFLLDSLRVDEAGNALVVFGPEPLLKKVAEDVARIDEPATGVTVTATTLESASSREALASLGVSYGNEHGQASVTPEEGEITYTTVGLNAEQLAATVRALAAEQRVRVASSSSVTVASGATGEVFAGLDKYVPLPTGWSGDISIEPVSAGAKLTVTPWAGREMISMKVAAETKEIEAVDPVTGLPVTNTRAASGTFCLRSGETVAIGGLRQRETAVTVRKIPLLGGLPLIGGLFRTKLRKRSASEVTVLLTATIAETRASEQQAAPAAPAGGADAPAPRGIGRW